MFSIRPAHCGSTRKGVRRPHVAGQADQLDAVLGCRAASSARSSGFAIAGDRARCSALPAVGDRRARPCEVEAAGIRGRLATASTMVRRERRVVGRWRRAGRAMLLPRPAEAGRRSALAGASRQPAVRHVRCPPRGGAVLAAASTWPMATACSPCSASRAIAASGSPHDQRHADAAVEHAQHLGIGRPPPDAGQPAEDGQARSQLRAVEGGAACRGAGRGAGCRAGRRR